MVCAAFQPGEWAGEWAAARGAFFPSIKATMIQILIVGRFYVDALQAGPLGVARMGEPVLCTEPPILRGLSQDFGCDGLDCAGKRRQGWGS